MSLTLGMTRTVYFEDENALDAALSFGEGEASSMVVEV